MGSDAHPEDNKTLCITCCYKKTLKVTKLQQQYSDLKNNKTTTEKLIERPSNQQKQALRDWIWGPTAIESMAWKPVRSPRGPARTPQGRSRTPQDLHAEKERNVTDARTPPIHLLTMKGLQINENQRALECTPKMMMKFLISIVTTKTH